jgi:hypothetical protein
MREMDEFRKGESFNTKMQIAFYKDQNMIAKEEEELKNRIIEYEEKYFTEKIKPIFDEIINYINIDNIDEKLKNNPDCKELTILSLGKDIADFLHKQNNKIIQMKKDMEVKFNTEINKLLEQSKLE